MAVTPEDEAPREPGSEGFSDAVTFAFGDPVADVYGVARVGLSTTATGESQASGLAILFDGPQAAAVRAAGGLDDRGPRLGRDRCRRPDDDRCRTA